MLSSHDFRHHTANMLVRISLYRKRRQTTSRQNATDQSLHKPTTQHPNNPLAQRPSKPSTQPSNNATIKQFNNPIAQQPNTFCWQPVGLLRAGGGSRSVKNYTLHSFDPKSSQLTFQDACCVLDEDCNTPAMIMQARITQLASEGGKHART